MTKENDKLVEKISKEVAFRYIHSEKWSKQSKSKSLHEALDEALTCMAEEKDKQFGDPEKFWVSMWEYSKLKAENKMLKEYEKNVKANWKEMMIQQEQSEFKAVAEQAKAEGRKEACVNIREKVRCHNYGSGGLSKREIFKIINLVRNEPKKAGEQK